MGCGLAFNSMLIKLLMEIIRGEKKKKNQRKKMETAGSI